MLQLTHRYCLFIRNLWRLRLFTEDRHPNIYIIKHFHEKILKLRYCYRITRSAPTFPSSSFPALFSFLSLSRLSLSLSLSLFFSYFFLFSSFYFYCAYMPLRFCTIVMPRTNRLHQRRPRRSSLFLSADALFTNAIDWTSNTAVPSLYLQAVALKPDNAPSTDTL
ncbi:unnamed protein product [Acanthosepion pharaonis]|uniref:Transmembrane protein n=1 Tax=Acanthosepion pharaonis TaxID=158019 RepID=A0A812DJW3_ACAPH|nr:unnamed protein product [Sepia pharaonis]